MLFIMAWTRIPTFDRQSRKPVCSICNQQQRATDQRGNPTTAFRTGAYIEHEGYFDICSRCARELAEMQGFVTPETHTDLQEAHQEVTDRLSFTEVELAERRETIKVLAAEVANADATLEITRQQAYDDGAEAARSEKPVVTVPTAPPIPQAPDPKPETVPQVPKRRSRRA